MLKLGAEAREKVRRTALQDLKRANEFYEQSVEPVLLQRRRIYEADRKMYAEMFPRLRFSDYVSHDMYAWVQWALAVVLDAFFGSQRVIAVVGQGQDDGDRAETMGELIRWQVEQGNHGFMLFSTWFEEALAYNFGVIKCWWQRVSEPVTESVVLPPDRMMALGQQEGVEILSVSPPNALGDLQAVIRRTVTTQNSPRLDHVSPFDMRWLPEARSLDSSLFVAQRQIVTGDVLMAGVEAGIYDRAETNAALDGAAVISWTNSDLEINPELDYASVNTPDDDRARRQVEVFECYVRCDVNNDGRLEDVIVTVAGDRLLRVEENSLGRLPFFALSASRDPKRVLAEHSMSDIEGELQNLRVALTRQILLNVSTNNMPRAFVDEAKINMDDLVHDKAYVRCTGKPSEIMSSLPTVPLAGWTMTFIEYLRSVEEEWTGKTRYNQGTDANSLNKTATGISLIMKSSAQRINHIVKIFAETGIADLYRFLVWLNQSFMDQRQVIRLLDRPLEIMPDDLHGNFDVVVHSDVGLGEKEQSTNVLTAYLKEFFPFAAQLGIANAKDFSKASVRLFELLGWKDAKTFLRSPEEIEAMQAQQAQQAQAQAQAAQGQAVNAAGEEGARAGFEAAMKQVQSQQAQGGMANGR